MKKFTKITLITGSIMGAVGLLLLLAGLALGFSTGELAEVVEGRGIQIFRSDIYTGRDSSGSSSVHVSERFTPEDEVQGLDLEVDYGRVYVTLTTESDIVIEGKASRYFSAVVDRNGTLVIRNLRSGSGSSGLRRGDVDLEILIPEGYVFSGVEFVAGAGTLTAEKIQAGELTVEVGAGTFEGTDFQVSGNVYLDGGAGSMLLQGEVSGDVSADCGVGSITMKLTNKYEDFNYYIDCGIGTVITGEDSYSGLGREVVRENGADQEMDLDCGIGEICVEF